MAGGISLLALLVLLRLVVGVVVGGDVDAVFVVVFIVFFPSLLVLFSTSGFTLSCVTC